MSIWTWVTQAQTQVTESPMSIYLEFPSIPDYPVYCPMEEIVRYLSCWGINDTSGQYNGEAGAQDEPGGMPAIILPYT